MTTASSALASHPEPLLGFGDVRHLRLRPARNAFSYPTYFLMLPMRALHLHGSGALAHNRRAALSFFDKDHGDGSANALSWLDALLLREGVQDGRLILGCVHGAVQVGATIGVLPDDRIVAGGEVGRAHRDGAAEQRGELQMPVTIQARVRRAPGGVGGGERRDDVLLELPLEVERVKGDAQCLADGAGILDAFQPAA